MPNPIAPALGEYTATQIGVLVTNSPSENSDAIEQWINLLPGNTGGVLLFDQTDSLINVFYDFKRTIVLDKPVILKCGGAPGGTLVYSTYIRFPANTNGIHIRGLIRKPDGTFSRKGYGSRLEDIQLVGLGFGNASSGHGILMEAPGEIKNCFVQNFGGNGINIQAAYPGDLDPDNNADLWRIENTRSSSNKGHGLYINGKKTNAGLALGLDCSFNEGYGIYDHSFLGNTFIGCHTEANRTGSYRVDIPTSRSTFLGCYVESGQGMLNDPMQGMPDLSSNATWLGGLAEGRIFGGTVLKDGFFDRVTVRASGDGHYSAASELMTMGSTNEEGLQAYLRFSTVEMENAPPNQSILHFDSNLHQFVWYSTAGDPGFGVSISSSGAIISERAVLPGQFQFPQGLFVGTQRWESGYDSPATSSNAFHFWQRGDIRWNYRPSAGEPIGWVCVMSGMSGDYTENLTAAADGTRSIILSGPTAQVLRVGDLLSINGVQCNVTALSGIEMSVSDIIPAGSGLVITYIAGEFQPFGKIAGGAGDSTGTPGGTTINSQKGRSTIPAGASSVVITNSRVTSTSIIHATLQTADITLVSILNVIPTGGSFTINGNSNATGPVNICWSIDE